jgi:hypothetical protein
MPIKRRVAKARDHRLTAAAVEAYRNRDTLGLHRELGLRPWEVSPLDVDGPEPPAWANSGPWLDSWPKAWALRAELEAGA